MVQCRIKLILGPGRRRSTGPVALVDRNLLPENLVMSILSEPQNLGSRPKRPMDKPALGWWLLSYENYEVIEANC
ncbi:hypothetical protein TNCV_2242741 [Trichonephila clavipes]|nr:hypothetical protein TNCV_2242741 [Trichonephila clavipes]